MFTLPIAIAALLALIPYLAAAFFGDRLKSSIQRLSVTFRILAPAVLSIPYLIVASSNGMLRWYWLALYILMPMAIAAILVQVRKTDPLQQGDWREYLILISLGLTVDLRWFESAWPPHLAVFNKVLLLDAGIYGFLMLRELDGIGFDLRLKWRDLRIGFQEFLFYTPMALLVGLSIGFLHAHAVMPSLLQFSSAYAFTFLFIAVPEELFFRGWVQNLLERRMGRNAALITASVLFGLSHWNKRTVNFNWQYVLLATLAGFFYGRSWRKDRRVGASAITHATVDTVWSIWLR